MEPVDDETRNAVAYGVDGWGRRRGGAIVIAYGAFLCDAGDCESLTVMTTL
jgi:hypothetical protein